jgi:hypothetical protein
MPRPIERATKLNSEKEPALGPGRKVGRSRRSRLGMFARLRARPLVASAAATAVAAAATAAVDRAESLSLWPFSKQPKKLTPTLVVDARAELGEGPIWDARSGKLLWLDILNSKVMQYSPKTSQNVVHDLSPHAPSVSTIVPVSGSDTKVVLGVQSGFALYDLETKTLEAHPSNGSLHGPFTRMNDGKCDPQGRAQKEVGKPRTRRVACACLSRHGSVSSRLTRRDAP